MRAFKRILALLCMLALVCSFSACSSPAVEEQSSPLNHFIDVAVAYRRSACLREDGKVRIVGEAHFVDLHDGAYAPWEGITAISVAPRNTFCGLKADGSLVLERSLEEEPAFSPAAAWTDLMYVAGYTTEYDYSESDILVGVKKDGTVVALGDNSELCQAIEAWTGVEETAVADNIVLGKRADGSALVAWAEDNEIHSTEWNNIQGYDVKYTCALGLREDGTVCLAGVSPYTELDVAPWKEIRQVSVGETFVLGLRADGTVVAAGEEYDGRFRVDSWKNVDRIFAGLTSYGVCEDGSVLVCTPDPGSKLYEEIYNIDAILEHIAAWSDITRLSESVNKTGFWHVVGLRSDELAVAAGDAVVGQTDVQDWEDIVEISAYGNTSLGLRGDGTVITAGSGGIDYWIDASQWLDVTHLSNGFAIDQEGHLLENPMPKRVWGAGFPDEVKAWTGLIAVTGSYPLPVGLKQDGILVGAISEEMETWRDITAIAPCELWSAIALTKDGTVLSDYDKIDLSDWSQITAIAAGDYDTFAGLHEDGTVVVYDTEYLKQADVDHWQNITAIACGNGFVVGLMSDGTVVLAGNGCEYVQEYVEIIREDILTWTDIKAITVGEAHVLGLKQDGTVVAAGSNYYGSCNT